MTEPVPSSSDNPWQTHRTRTVYENPWITVRESGVTNPSGGNGIYGVVHFKKRAVGVIPIDEDSHTWLVGQYRYPTDTYEWEIPEGGADEHESPEEAGKRELREETGIEAGEWVLFLEMQLSNSVTNEVSYSYLARNLSHTEAQPEDTEALAVRRLPLEEAFAMVDRGEIRDAISVASLLKLRLTMMAEKSPAEGRTGTSSPK